MSKKRHKWSGCTKERGLDSSSCSCINCGMIRQYVLSIPTYFNPCEERVYDRIAPTCDPANKEKNDNYQKQFN